MPAPFLNQPVIARLAIPIRARASALLALALLVLPGGPALAHGATAGSKPLVPGAMRLKHRQPAEIIALFARERLPDAGREGFLRAARAGIADSLLPAGVDGVLRGPEADAVVLVGDEERLPELGECIQVLDVPVERTAPDRGKMLLTLRQADARRLRVAVLRLPGAGSATVIGGKLALEGSPEWLHRALRQVIRAELGVPEPLAPPTP